MVEDFEGTPYPSKTYLLSLLLTSFGWLLLFLSDFVFYEERINTRTIDLGALEQVESIVSLSNE